jgi:hypothetical protein
VIYIGILLAILTLGGAGLWGLVRGICQHLESNDA